jgi:opacity protein-like surface antigen
MKKTLISALLAASLIVPVGAAQAQWNGHGGGGPHGGGAWHGGGGPYRGGGPVWHGRDWGPHPGYRWSYYNGAWGWWPLAVLGGVAVGAALAAPYYYAPPPAPPPAYYAPPPYYAAPAPPPAYVAPGN